MMKRLVSVLALLAAACSPAPAPSDDTGAAHAPRPAFPADSSIVFAGDKALELTEPCSRAAPASVEGTWTPTEAEIARMELALADLVADALAAEVPTTGLAAEDYARQYGGLIVAGRRIIYVNGFHAPEAPDGADVWRTFPMTICDGGPIMFGVEYDPATHAFENFAFNGGA